MSELKENIQKIQVHIDKIKQYLECELSYSDYLDLQLLFDDTINLIQKQEKIIQENKEAKQLYIPKSKVKELYEHYKDTGFIELKEVLQKLLKE